MARPQVVIWGAGGHALVVADILRLAGEYDILGFLDDRSPQRRGELFAGGRILGGREQLDTLLTGGVHLLLAVGDCQARLSLARELGGRGLPFATAAHPRATLAADVRVGAGSVVAAGAVINPATRLGGHTIVNTCASIDHECIVDDGVHVAPGARLAGRVSVGRGTWVGMGAVVLPGVRIGAGTVIGAGAVVLHDVPDGLVAYGVPARVVRRVDVQDVKEES
jgi:acetyltransferase EpsM